jgi:hypothetical protein
MFLMLAVFAVLLRFVQGGTEIDIVAGACLVMGAGLLSADYVQRRRSQNRP